jgi:hypothetical protein
MSAGSSPGMTAVDEHLLGRVTDRQSSRPGCHLPPRTVTFRRQDAVDGVHRFVV